MITFEAIAAARRAAWDKYNEDPSNTESLDAAIIVQRQYYAWWAEWKNAQRARTLPMNGTDFHTFGEE